MAWLLYLPWSCFLNLVTVLPGTQLLEQAQRDATNMGRIATHLRTGKTVFRRLGSSAPMNLQGQLSKSSNPTRTLTSQAKLQRQKRRCNVILLPKCRKQLDGNCDGCYGCGDGGELHDESDFLEAKVCHKQKGLMEMGEPEVLSKSSKDGWFGNFRIDDKHLAGWFVETLWSYL